MSVATEKKPRTAKKAKGVGVIERLVTQGDEPEQRQLLVCAACLHGRAEVRLMSSKSNPFRLPLPERVAKGGDA